MKKLVLTLTSLVLLLTSLTGCGAEKAVESLSNVKDITRSILDGDVPELESTTDLVLILQRGMNNMPDFDNSAFEKDLEDVVKSGTVHFIVPDSTPESNYVSLRYEKIDSNLPAQRINEEIQSRINNVTTYSYTFAAKSEECNLVKSLLLAKQLLDSSDSGRQKKIVICSNMLNTCEPLKFTTEMLDNIQTSSIDILENQINIPDLTDYIVEVYYCGQVISPQDELSEMKKSNLESIWTYYFEKTHAKVQLPFHKDLPTKRQDTYQNHDDLPAVSCIETTPDEDAIALGKVININEEAVKFDADKDTFKEPEKAKKTLAEYVDSINAYPKSILLIGITAKPLDAKEVSCRELSLQRAKRVKETLIDLGVKEPNKLICAGGGYSTPWYKNDRDESGNFVEAIGALNRNIILLSDNNEQFDELVAKYGE